VFYFPSSVSLVTQKQVFDQVFILAAVERYIPVVSVKGYVSVEGYIPPVSIKGYVSVKGYILDVSVEVFFLISLMTQKILTRIYP